MNIEPMGMWLIVETVKLEARVGRIFTSEQKAKEDIQLGRVFKVGTYVNQDTGVQTQLPFEVGNLVIYTPDAMVVPLRQTALATYGLVPGEYTFLHPRHVIGRIGAENEEEAVKLEAMLSPDDVDSMDEEGSLQIGAEAEMKFRGE